MTRVQETWRALPYDRGSSLAHIEAGDALVRLASVPTLWWHTTDSPTLILGAAQRPDAIDTEHAVNSGITLVRRHAGGTSVFASPHVLGLDIALPAGHRLLNSDVVEAYRWLGEVWVDALHDLGVDGHLVSVAEARQAPDPDPLVADGLRSACFGTLSPYEVTAGGRKLVGLAQVRRRAGGLLQAGIHLQFDADTLAALLAPTVSRPLAAALRSAAVGLDDVSPTPLTAEAVMTTFDRVLQQRLSIDLIEGDWTDEERHQMSQSLARQRALLQ
jgi:lipoate-protein ligase A